MAPPTTKSKMLLKLIEIMAVDLGDYTLSQHHGAKSPASNVRNPQSCPFASKRPVPIITQVMSNDRAIFDVIPERCVSF